MGCDIHLLVEQQDSAGTWKRVHPPESARDEWLLEQAEKHPDDEWYTSRSRLTWYDGRNYCLFGMLANVRNGYGFAGCDTGDPVTPISEPRGFPSDLSDEVRAIVDGSGDDNDLDLGDHDFSWLLVSELVDYDWNQSCVQRGWVDPWNFELWRRHGKPSSWSGGITGPNIDHITHQLMGQLIDSGDIVFDGDESDWLKPRFTEHRPYTTNLGRTMSGWGLPTGSVGAAMAAPKTRPEHYCIVEWRQPYHVVAGKFYSRTLPALKSLGKPEQTRIVFGFDS